MGWLTTPKKWALGATAGLSTGLLAAPGLTAERIEFFYGPVEIAIRVDDIQHFADTGEVQGSLRPIVRRLTPAQQQSLRDLLTRPLPFDVVTISELAYAPVGIRLLQQLGELIQTNDYRNGFLALRASLILAAAQEPGLTVMHVLEQFPLDTVQINYGLARQLLGEGQAFFQRRETVLAAIEAQAQGDRLPTPLPPELVPESQSELPQQSPAQPGSIAWDRRTIEFVNPLRQTLPVADLYLPRVSAPPGSLSVVVISHGAASSRHTLAYLAEHLASHGYAAVVLEHEDNGQQFEQFLSGFAQPPDPITLISRPQDVTAVLDALTRMAATDPSLGRLNLAEVGVVGHSLGGYTALAVAGATINLEALRQVCPSSTQSGISLNLSLLVQCELLSLDADLPNSLRDQRVTSAIAINPLTSHIFGKAGLSQIEVPVMVVAGTDDYFTPALPEQIEPFGWLAGSDKHLVVVNGGTHFSFLAGNTGGGALPLPEGFLGPEAQAAHPYLKGLSVAFLNRYQQGQPTANAYLSQPYLDTFGSHPFRVSIVEMLPAVVPD